MKTIYVAGPLSPKGDGNKALEYLSNVRHMTLVATLLIGHGWAPFCPGIDFAYFLVGPRIPTEAEIRAVSIEWLKRCDAMVLVGSWKLSKGCRAELGVAKKLKIPIYYSWREVPNA
jgi:nucleoside 2-deoxyribosyltransferase